jgi:hypothetical protein
LYIILYDHPESIHIEQLLSQADPLTDGNIHSILSTIAQFTSLDQSQLSVKHTLAETCQFETNIFLLHYAIVFILDHFQEQSTADQQLLANLTRGIIRRHSILYLLIQYDKQEKHYQLTKKFFHLISTILIEKLHHALHHPIEINTDHQNNEQVNSTTHTYLILPTFTDEQVNLIQQLQTELHRNKTLAWSKDLKKQYIQLDSSLIEFLLIFLASFDFNHSQSQSVRKLANTLQELFLNKRCTPCFMTLKQFNAPVPIRQSLDEVREIVERWLSSSNECFPFDRHRPVNRTMRVISNNLQSKTMNLLPIIVNDAYRKQRRRARSFSVQRISPSIVRWRSTMTWNNHSSIPMMFNISFSNPRISLSFSIALTKRLSPLV